MLPFRGILALFNCSDKKCTEKSTLVETGFYFDSHFQGTVHGGELMAAEAGSSGHMVSTLRIMELLSSFAPFSQDPLCRE